MNYFSLLIIALVLAVSPLQDEFVLFQEEKTEINASQKEYEISLTFKILDGYYIQAETGVPENIIPTQVTFQKSESFEITAHQLSSRGEQTIFLDTTAHKVLSDSFKILVFIKLKNADSKHVKKLVGEVYYQACNKQQCFYPRTLNFQVEFI